jgi:hypothetical protein
MRKALTGVLVVVMCLFMFTGCFGAKTLEEKMTDYDIQKIVNEIKNDSMYKTYYKDCKMTVEENHITFEYWYNVTLDDAEMAAQKQALKNSGLLETIDSSKDSIEKDTGIRPSMITYKYYTADDRLIVTIEK